MKAEATREKPRGFRTKAEAAENALHRASQRGGITLILGSGISVSRKLPDWNSLAKDLWREAFGGRRSPWQAKRGKRPLEVPQFLPIVFELVQEKLGEEQFLESLRKNLYRNARPPIKDRRFSKSHQTLAVLARLVVQEFKRGRNSRIERIVTLNADDMLEQAVAALVPPKIGQPETFVISIRDRPSRLTSDIVWDGWGGWRPWRSISIYHIHGFLPSDRRYAESDYMLVFTDAQYWSTSATAFAFANHVMLSALSESQCVFIGLSMTDVNLLRWLAFRTLEFERDVKEAQLLNLQENVADDAQLRVFSIEGYFSQHFWIRPRSDDPTGFLSEFLEKRGITPVDLKNWTGPHFQRLIQKCFPMR
jgi:SIR2-like domain